MPVLVDGAQAAPHMPVDVQALDCDFYAFSGHKLYGPTGIGVLYGKAELLETMPPYQGGGDMIRSVTFEKTTYNALPHKFEAGTPDIAGAIGLGAAIDYLSAIGLDAIAAHEQDLLDYATEALSRRRRRPHHRHRAHKAASSRSCWTAFIRTTSARSSTRRHRRPHRASLRQPVMERFRVPATARASFALYNTREEIDALVRAIERVREVFH